VQPTSGDATYEPLSRIHSRRNQARPTQLDFGLHRHAKHRLSFALTHIVEKTETMQLVAEAGEEARASYRDHFQTLLPELKFQ
jgi:hypothetical protein